MNYRETRGGVLNCEKTIFDGVGKYEVPAIAPVYDESLLECELVGFNYALTEKHPEDKILHFFVDDYQFERVWNDPDKYIPILKRFKAVLAPDFSIYTDFPRAVNMFNHYRKHWCAAYWQKHGITVIPTICWGDKESFDWCLDGEPEGAIIATSCVGFRKGVDEHANDKPDSWKELDKAVDKLKPKAILLFCGASEKIHVPDEVSGVKGVKKRSKQLDRLKGLKKGKKRSV